MAQNVAGRHPMDVLNGVWRHCPLSSQLWESCTSPFFAVLLREPFLDPTPPCTPMEYTAGTNWRAHGSLIQYVLSDVEDHAMCFTFQAFAVIASCLQTCQGDVASPVPSARMRDALQCVAGIAYDPATKRIFVTGKYWPRLYQIEPVLTAAAPTADQLTQTRSKCISPPQPE